MGACVASSGSVTCVGAWSVGGLSAQCVERYENRILYMPCPQVHTARPSVATANARMYAANARESYPRGRANAFGCACVYASRYV